MDNIQPARTPCPECGGQRVLVQCDPRMAIRTGVLSFTRLHALTCIECGYTRLYANRPDRLKKVVKEIGPL
ncbi:MAG TPA: hypothetical protein VKV37_23950 [Ktedonobacteraceae bacterium]|jgi:DNA-directed RNA polymerase subunit RPC12/RpoP|nr:hypothetical protein [Ktedonobacteraceae bacterium]